MKADPLTRCRPAEVFEHCETRWNSWTDGQWVRRQENDCTVLINRVWSTIRLPSGGRVRVKTKSSDFKFYLGQQQLF